MHEPNPTPVLAGEAPRSVTRLARPQLLAPAGNWDCARAAVENGADAIYFGLGEFNARMRADNFTEADLPPLMRFLHARGVRGYVCFNTLVFADELAQAERALRAVIAAGVDAALVQDVGICRLLRRLSPDFPIHASTQMTITSATGIECARELGCHLVVLARECSVKDLARIRSELRESRVANVPSPPGAARDFPLEVFVHGALCVAYSGQCLTSEALGGRSANRGVCAQACRMPYDLIADGQPVPLGDRRYLLSPQDLVGLEMLPALIEAGVSSLKIEGRLKTPNYVANLTRIYREAIDRVYAALAAGPASESISASAPRQLARELWNRSRYELEMAFSRGLYTGWLGGLNNQELVHGRFGKKRGVYLGEVRRVQGDRVWVNLAGPLKRGDGLVFDAGKPDEDEEGGRVYDVQRASAGAHDREEAVLAFGRGDIDFRRVHVGDKVWKTSDPELERRLRQTYTAAQPQFQRPIHIEAHGSEGQPLRLIARDASGHVAAATSSLPLARAETQPLTLDRLRAQLGRLGGTPFRLDAVTSHLEGAVLLPLSELNRLRRALVGELESQRSALKRWTLTPANEGATAIRATVAPPPALAPDAEESPAMEAELIVLVRAMPQLEAALRSGVTRVYCELEDPKRYREAVRRVREATGCAGPPREIWVAPPRVFKPGEEWILRLVRSCDADGYLVRNYDHLKYFSGDRRIGDFSLNVANALAAEWFIQRHGLERVTASYDLNVTQLEALLASAPPAWLEITLHQHMPMFHMEHCVFCAFLTRGTDYTNCGRPCDTREVKLRDRVGAEHVVKADAGCRNTVFNARAQTGAEFAGRLRQRGARHFRIEFLDEDPEQVVQTIARYRQLIRGEIGGAQLWRELKLLNQLGVTRGQLDKEDVRLAESRRAEAWPK
jgi:putative protease